MHTTKKVRSSSQYAYDTHGAQGCPVEAGEFHMLDMAGGFTRVSHSAKGPLDLITEVRDRERTLNAPKGPFKALFEYLFRREILCYRLAGPTICPVAGVHSQGLYSPGQQ